MLVLQREPWGLEWRGRGTGILHAMVEKIAATQPKRDQGQAQRWVPRNQGPLDSQDKVLEDSC